MNKVLSTLVGNQVENPSSVIEQGFSGNNSVTAGCLIRATSVYSICNGTVISTGIDPINDTLTITVEVNSQKWIRYCRLSPETLLNVGQKIQVGNFLGFAYDGLVRVEYCTSVPSKFPVRELHKQLYKHDPTPVLFGGAI